MTSVVFAGKLLTYADMSSVPIEARVEWIRLLMQNIQQFCGLGDAAALAAARSIEHLAHSRRQQVVMLSDSTCAMRYGETMRLPIEEDAKHVVAAASEYMRLLSRVVWATVEHGTRLPSMGTPCAWLDLSDDALQEGTAHAAWEKEYLDSQASAQQLMEDSRQDQTAAAGKGIYKCRKCKSFNVDYRELQTRGGDEGMTVYLCCNVCFHRDTIRSN